MLYLLDTHVLLWWLTDNPRLSANVRRRIEDRQNTIFVSAASAWEIAIKKALGKLKAPDNLEEVLVRNNFTPLPISIPHAITAGALPAHHDDPFDRMLIAQAKTERLIILTHDKRFIPYRVKIELTPFTPTENRQPMLGYPSPDPK